MIKAIIFDLDGVITDTAELHYNAWKKCAASIDIAIDSQFNEKLKGVGRMESLELILKHGGKQNQFSEEEKRILADAKNDYYKTLIGTNSLKMLPGIPNLLLTIKQSGYKLGLASASKNAPLILQALEIIHLFDAIADPSTIKEGKPAPDIFLQAAQLLGVKTQECIAIEDAQSGIEAIKKAGMFAVGVGDEAYLNQADYVVPSTKELSVHEMLIRWQKKSSN
jgi:beta-phosphoglucomutase